jgi:2'-5' RNA ligase
MKQRIFLGIEASSKLKTLVGQWQCNHRSLPVRFIKPSNLHLTVIPPWYEDPQCVIKRLRHPPLSMHSFFLSFYIVRLGPDPKRPRLIWIEGHRSRQLESLKKELGSVGPCQEKRPLIPHITIARAKRKDEKLLFQTHICQQVSWTMEISSCTLFKSYLSPKGAEYEILARIPLMETSSPNT